MLELPRRFTHEHFRAMLGFGSAMEWMCSLCFLTAH